MGAETVAVNDMFVCRNGKYVMLEAGPPYAKLLNGYSVFFDCGDDKAAIQDSFATMVKYLYDRDTIEGNHEVFVCDGTIVGSRDVDILPEADLKPGAHAKMPEGR